MFVSSMDSDWRSVAIVMPVLNGAKWLNDALISVKEQTFNQEFLVSIYDDGSVDNSSEIIESWIHSLVIEKSNIKVIYGRNETNKPGGCGAAKNRAVAQCKSKYLCFFDCDDIMDSKRLEILHSKAVTEDENDFAIIGSSFARLPIESTVRYTNWANSLSNEQLYTQIYTSNGPTLIMPTWFCSRKVFERNGGFDESGHGVPEDLIFFYQHLDLKGKLIKVSECLLIYRYHELQTTFAIEEETIWNLRLERFEKLILSQWNEFMIWNAGKLGRKFYRSISAQNREKVKGFCDVDEKKISKGVYIYELCDKSIKPKIPITGYTEAKAPLVICVKLGLTGGQFERNLSQLNLKEGIDYFHFG